MLAAVEHSWWRHLLDAPRMLVVPVAVFYRIAHDGAYGWALSALLLLSVWIGWSTVQTGFIDRSVDVRTSRALADLEREQFDIVTRTELSDRMQKLREASTFSKLIARGAAVLGPPLFLLTSILLIAVVLFAVVALAGNKADYQTLLAICVYSAVVQVIAAGLRLVMMVVYRTGEVRTSLDALVPAGNETQALRVVLSGVDPFRIWFWVLVAIGLIVTGQLSRRASIATCTVLALVGTVVAMIPAAAGTVSAG
jgi:hypothetical protein